MAQAQKYVAEGYGWCVDLDLEKFFDSIPHEPLLACARMRVVDRSVLHLIRLWLNTPVWEAAEGNDEKRKIHRPQTGTPQGGVISPLLANIYLHWFDVLFHRAAGPAGKYGAKLVRDADDCVPRAQRAERACSV